ncbi:MAG: hypothetical protein KDI46_08015 [Alphaproteobacteria bacterium]|nr:hypothetical protein [Alphaproteobacteria bacterium]
MKKLIIKSNKLGALQAQVARTGESQTMKGQEYQRALDESGVRDNIIEDTEENRNAQRAAHQKYHNLMID